MDVHSHAISQCHIYAIFLMDVVGYSPIKLALIFHKSRWDLWMCPHPGAHESNPCVDHLALRGAFEGHCWGLPGPEISRTTSIYSMCVMLCNLQCNAMYCNDL